MRTSLYEKAMGAGGFYELNYADPEEAALALETLGGEERLKKEHPLVYEAFRKTEELHRMRRRRRMAVQEEKKVGLNVTYYDGDPVGQNYVMKASLMGLLADPALTADEAAEGKAGRSWIGANVSVKMFDHRDPTGTPLAMDACYLEDVGDFEVDSQSEEIGKTEAENCAMSGVMNALDPDSGLRSFATGAKAKGKLIPLVRDFNVTDPYSRLGNNPILMLYGRNRQNNQGYVNADYYNDNDSGEYFRNRPRDGRLKTLMPMSGIVTFEAGCSFPEGNILHPPKNGNMVLSQLKIGDTRVATQYADLGVQKAYEILAKCFEKDTSGVYPKLKFNIADNGSVDWHSDTNGIGNWKNSALTYLLCGGFEVDILDPHGIPCTIQLSITSREAGKMNGKQYYVSNSSQVFVPPIEVHWGCFAPETMVRLAGEGEACKRMDRLRPGDRLVTAEGTAATLADMAVGEEDRILRVKASSGSIRLTAGHPVMMADGSVKGAGCLVPGDLVKTPSGGAKVLEVVEEAYRGRVYNPVLEESGREGMYILAEGFFCGDYNAQNRPSPRKEAVLTGQQQELRDQFRNLSQG